VALHEPRLDRAALEALYQRLEGPMIGVVYRWLWNTQDAQEVVQEAFLRLWGMRARVEMASVESLVWRIALNEASSRRRRRRVLSWGGLGIEPAGRADFHDAPAVRRAVDALPESLRSVVMLCEVAGLSYAEVGAILDIPAGTVGSRRHRALARLQEALR